MKINHAKVASLIKAVRFDAMGPFAEAIQHDMIEGTPRARKPRKSLKEHVPLWTRNRVEKTADTILIGSTAPYQSVAEFTMRRDGTYSWRDKSRIYFMKRALYQKREVGPR